MACDMLALSQAATAEVKASAGLDALPASSTAQAVALPAPLPPSQAQAGGHRSALPYKGVC